MMNTKMRTLCALVAASMLAACGGHGSSPVLPKANAPAIPTQSAKVHVTIVIPAARTGSARHANYISASTQSIGFWATANDGNWQHETAWQYANVTPGSPGCTTSAGNTTCTLTFGALGGNIQYTIDAYDQPDGKGNLLSAATAQATWVAGQDNAFSVTLDGVVAKYVLALAQPTLAEGTPADDALAISAYDTDGNLIVNSPEYADSNGNGASGFVLTTTNVDGTDVTVSQNNGQLTPIAGTSGTQFFLSYPLTNISVGYAGGVAPDATFAINATLGSTANTATLHVGSATNAAAFVYAGTGLGNWLYGYPGGGNGSVAAFGPPPAPTGCGTYTYDAVATDANDNVAYVAACDGSSQQIVASPADSNSAAWSITGLPYAGSSTTLPEDFIALGFDSSNNIYAYEDDGPVCSSGCTLDIGAVTVLKAGSTGAFSTSMDLRAIDCVNGPEAMTVAPDGTVYVAHVGDSNTNLEAIEVFAPGTSGYFECTGNEVAGTPTVTASRYVGGTNSGLDKVTQLALDSSGNVYAANDYANSVTVYGATANGNVAPDRTISGSATGIGAPTGVGVDAYGNVYVTNSSGTYAGDITVYASGANGDVAPTRIIQTGMSSSGALTLIK